LRFANDQIMSHVHPAVVLVFSRTSTSSGLLMHKHKVINIELVTFLSKVSIAMTRINWCSVNYTASDDHGSGVLGPLGMRGMESCPCLGSWTDGRKDVVNCGDEQSPCSLVPDELFYRQMLSFYGRLSFDPVQGPRSCTVAECCMSLRHRRL
jgi:hypothetical protein